MTYEPPRHDATNVFKQATKTALWGKPKSFNQCHKIRSLSWKSRSCQRNRELEPYKQEWKQTPDKADLFDGITGAVNLQKKKNLLQSFPVCWFLGDIFPIIGLFWTGLWVHKYGNATVIFFYLISRTSGLRMNKSDNRNLSFFPLDRGSWVLFSKTDLKYFINTNFSLRKTGILWVSGF